MSAYLSSCVSLCVRLSVSLSINACQTKSYRLCICRGPHETSSPLFCTPASSSFLFIPFLVHPQLLSTHSLPLHSFPSSLPLPSTPFHPFPHYSPMSPYASPVLCQSLSIPFLSLSFLISLLPCLPHHHSSTINPTPSIDDSLRSRIDDF